MKIALIGDGKMARAIVPRAEGLGHRITAMLGASDNERGTGITREALGNPDVAIEFTEPTSAESNVLACARAGIPIVVGTTGWYERLDVVMAEVRKAGGTMFWAPNFSIGVAVLSAALEAASRALRDFSGFDVHLIETHHAAKKDRPSGTAASLARIAEQGLGREVPITSIRMGQVPGTHDVVFDSTFEQVRLIHEARDRRVFADGAIVAAEWLQGKKGVFTMSDLLRRTEETR